MVPQVKGETVPPHRKERVGGPARQRRWDDREGPARCRDSEHTITELPGRTHDKETRELSAAPRVWLNPAAVWELLDGLDISQNQLARLAGISPGHLSLLMNGKRSPASGGG